MSLIPTNSSNDAETPLNDSTSTYTDGADGPNDRTMPGRDSVMPESSLQVSTLTDTHGVAETSEARYIYYRIYAEDGAIPSKTPVVTGDPFLGRIKARSVAPPHTVQTVKRSIAKVEDIKDYTSTSLFLTPYSQSPLGDGKVAILDRTGLGSTPQEPLALVAKMSDSERSVLESEERSGLASAAEPDPTPTGIRYLYYLLYADSYEVPSKAAIDPEEPSLGRIRADSIAPPHSPASIKRCISRVERTPALAHADLFVDILCDTSLKEGHISILGTDCPGLSPKEPMAIVQMPIVQVVESPSIPDGKYVIKNRAADIFWHAGSSSSFKRVYFWATTMEKAKDNYLAQWHITHDSNGIMISMMTSWNNSSSWVGAETTGSTVPVPWRLIPADSEYYYLTTDMNRVSQNPRVPAAQRGGAAAGPGLMATLKEGDQCQMWEFICI